MPVQSPVNYYDLLGVSKVATTGEIRAAYRARIALYHPDRSDSVHATAIAALLNEAWAVLRDPDRRQAYDGGTRAKVVSESRPARPAPKPPARPQPIRSNASNRRGIGRVKTLVTAQLTLGSVREDRRLSCTCLDLSPAGMAFGLAHPVDIGSRVTTTLYLADEAITTSALVVRCDPLKRRGRWKIAVAFDDLGQRSRQCIIGFVEAERHRRFE